jgi:CHAT domain-containing protein
MAGASSVVTALWEVGDCSTSLLFERFYHEYFAEAAPASEALRRAQTYLRSSSYSELDLVSKLASIWSVERSPTVLQLLNYHKRYAEKDPSRKPFADPYYWAGFIYSGAGGSAVSEPF